MAELGETSGQPQPEIEGARGAEEALRESEARLRLLIAQMPAILWTTDTDLRITSVLGGGTAALKLDPERLVGKSIFAYFGTDDPEFPPIAAHRQALEGRPSSYDREVDGRMWHLHVEPFRDAEGAIKGCIGVGVDISERREAEEALRQARAEAERAHRAESEFLSRASHELRTPLNVILGFAQLLEVDASTTEQRESVGEILKGGRRLLDLINEVLDMARIDTGRLHLSIEEVHVGQMLREMLDLVRPLAARRNVRLQEVEDGRLDRYVLADLQRLKQVLLNLLTNAIQYNREGGTVSLDCAPAAEGLVRITVRDTGPGIPPEKLGRLFTPFDRLGAEQTGIEGTGLGLALSKRLVEAMGGALGVESVPGQGSAFWVELPGADGPEDARGRPGDTGAQAGAPAKGLTVLYIEDNLSNLKLIERIAGRRPGVRILAAMQGGLGLALAREHRPDLVLLDLHLPDMPGEEVLRRLREDAETRAIPVVVLSADATPGRVQRLLSAGARAYLGKPLEVTKIMDLLDEMLREGTG